MIRLNLQSHPIPGDGEELKVELIPSGPVINQSCLGNEAQKFLMYEFGELPD